MLERSVGIVVNHYWKKKQLPDGGEREWREVRVIDPDKFPASRRDMAEPTPAPALGPDPLMPPLALAVFMACVAGGAALANCTVLAALLKRSRNGKSIKDKLLPNK